MKPVLYLLRDIVFRLTFATFLFFFWNTFKCSHSATERQMLPLTATSIVLSTNLVRTTKRNTMMERREIKEIPTDEAVQILHNKWKQRRSREDSIVVLPDKQRVT